VSDEIVRLLRASGELRSVVGTRIALIGGVARGAWALERNTFDVDIIVDLEDLAPMIQAAPGVGLVAVQRDVEKMAKSGMTRLRLPEHLSGEIRLDIIAATHPYYLRVLDRAVNATVYGIDIPVAAAEDLVVLKLMADRPQDRADVAAILMAQGGALDRALIRRELTALGFEVPPELAPRHDAER
jgi:predicted nucleotidyltransferase